MRRIKKREETLNIKCSSVLRLEKKNKKKSKRTFGKGKRENDESNSEGAAFV